MPYCSWEDERGGESDGCYEMYIYYCNTVKVIF